MVDDTKYFYILAALNQQTATRLLNPPCLFFEQPFLEHLPKDIHIQLVDSKMDDYLQLAKRANALWSSWDVEPNTNAVQHKLPLDRSRQNLKQFRFMLLHFHNKYPFSVTYVLNTLHSQQPYGLTFSITLHYQ